MDVEEMDYAKPTKKQGRVTTPQSDSLGDLFLPFTLSLPMLPGEQALRSNHKLKASSVITDHFSWCLPTGKYLEKVIVKQCDINYFSYSLNQESIKQVTQNWAQ